MAGCKLLCLLLTVAVLGATAAKINVNLTDKLVDLVKKKQFDGFVDELQRDDMDVNQPDSKGRLPLIEAVRTKEIKFVDALLQYGAFAKSKDPATGATPLHVAFQQNLPQIARMLLQYGADVNVEDKSGKKAREFAPTKEIRELIAAYDKDGPMAFEDTPGSWTRATKPSTASLSGESTPAEEYWFNTRTGDSRWNTPSSCAWQRVDVQGHPIKYVNAITGQEVHDVPPSLAWVKVRRDTQVMYYNWKVNATQLAVPEEVPKDMLADMDKNINVRWYNEKTGEFAWIDPAYHTVWRELKDEESKKSYFFNVETGESVWELPDAMAWTRVKDDETGDEFFHNRLTLESTWDAPAHMAWVRHDSDL
ncbi:hypothetical protein Agub_g12965 [Astrephomene gubernaculifera]|uniref:WW domain-containing protein n=1 Tax=Astrephomene gubernaculifera TaxID=47775 RepID=A0AAD3E1S4_9CHLO|nr:hypothetical protein Agub_g12965 [Astrephomene gubernaculifera]